VGALQGAVDRDGCGVERGGGFAGREAEDVAEDQYGALACGQVLKCRDEGELDALALLIAGLRAGQAAAESQPRIRVGFQPHRLGDWLGGVVVGVGGGPVVEREHASGPPLDRSEAGVGGDLVEPGADRASALEPWQGAPGAQQRLLQGIFGVGGRGEHAVAVGVQLAAVGSGESGEGVVVAPLGGLEQLALARGQQRASRAGSAFRPGGHRFGCQMASSPHCGAEMTLRHPAGPSRGASSTQAPSWRAWSVDAWIWSTST
jgi:hypothetical protein